MADARQDALNRAFSLLSAQLAALNEYRYSHVNERWGRDYHAALDILERAGFDVADFRVNPSDVAPIAEQRGYMTRQIRYSEDRKIDRLLFLSKLQAIVSYFQLADVQPPRVLGFRPPGS